MLVTSAAVSPARHQQVCGVFPHDNYEIRGSFQPLKQNLGDTFQWSLIIRRWENKLCWKRSTGEP